MQGFNMGRYVPPDLEGTVSGNQLSGKHALGARARKLKTEGVLIVRFEMPYAVWCNHCPKATIIGQGVRFNAEKKKIGNYYSTPVYSFRMKHAACGGAIEIHTDPKNTAYVVVEGGKARDTGEDRVREGEEGMEILTQEEREKRREDAFAALEGKKEDKAQEKEQGKRIVELYEARERDWDDPYEASRKLRKGFRVERKVREKEADNDEKLKIKMGLDVELLPAHEDDTKRAGLIEFGPLEGVDDGARKAASRPLFLLTDQQPSKTEILSRDVKSKSTALTKKERDAQRRRTALEQEIRDNSRAAKDPFLSFGTPATTTKSIFQSISGIKRKRPSADSESPSLASSPQRPSNHEMKPTQQPALVAYDSDDSD